MRPPFVPKHHFIIWDELWALNSLHTSTAAWVSPPRCRQVRWILSCILDWFQPPDVPGLSRFQAACSMMTRDWWFVSSRPQTHPKNCIRLGIWLLPFAIHVESLVPIILTLPIGGYHLHPWAGDTSPGCGGPKPDCGSAAAVILQTPPANECHRHAWKSWNPSQQPNAALKLQYNGDDLRYLGLFGLHLDS